MNIEKRIEKLKKLTEKLITKGNYEDAMWIISAVADIMYHYNQVYRDDDMENYIEILSKKILPSNIIKKKESVVLFYDGFGLNTRGLAQIYIRALCKHYKVIYVTDRKQKQSIPDICNILNKYNGIKYFLIQKNLVQRSLELNNVIRKYMPETMFLYTTPNDVAGICTFRHFEGQITRFQINLTDHAFWLGCDSFDYCLEFRDYGASISKKYRKIDERKLIKLPYYPIINNRVKFQGYPFHFKLNKNKLIFSGGSLYKTLGAGNAYYDIVDYILFKHVDTVFWYAGSGDHTEIDKLMGKYPNRVFFTPERKDLYQVLKKCTFYLSTYPICGGLMFQYAALAGKLPITLKFSDLSDEFLLYQKELNIEFSDVKEIKREIDKLLTDEKYLKTREKQIKKGVLKENEFELQLVKVIRDKRNDFSISTYDIDTSDLQREYLKQFQPKDFIECIATTKNKKILRYCPLEFLFKFFIKYLVYNWK